MHAAAPRPRRRPRAPDPAPHRRCRPLPRGRRDRSGGWSGPWRHNGGPPVHLGDQRTGRVDDRQVRSTASGAPGAPPRGRRSTTRAPRGTSSSSCTKTRRDPRVLDHVRVVHDLPADVDRSAEPFDRPLDDVDRALHPRAERPRRRQQRSRGPAPRAHCATTGAARRNAPNAGDAPPRVPIRSSGASAVSTIERAPRRTAGRRRTAASCAVSMSTASAPVAASAARSRAPDDPRRARRSGRRGYADRPAARRRPARAPRGTRP